MNKENKKYSIMNLLTLEKPLNRQMCLPVNDKRKEEAGLRTKGYFKKSYPDKPLISIVTVVYNGEKFLEEAIESVINQNYDNIEYIIVDGGSTDKTTDIIKKYEDQIDYWVSEPDEGQSDAFIKAFSICQGEWLTWLNGDDILLPGAAKKLLQAAQKKSDVECFTGNVIWTMSDNTIIKCRQGDRWNDLLPKFGILNVYGPTTFFKKELYERVEGINKNLHYKMDTDLWWQFYKAGAKFERLSGYIWTLRFHENAKTSGHFFKNSPYADLSHQSWQVIKEERDYIALKYNYKTSILKKIVGKILLFLNRLTSRNYLKSIYHTAQYSGQDLKEFYVYIK